MSGDKISYRLMAELLRKVPAESTEQRKKTRGLSNQLGIEELRQAMIGRVSKLMQDALTQRERQEEEKNPDFDEQRECGPGTFKIMCEEK